MKQITSQVTSLGAQYNKETNSVDFKLYSKNATKVFLCIFDNPLNEDVAMTLEMKKNNDHIWYTSVKDYILNCKKKPIYYGYRVFGDNWDYSENFEPNSNIGFKQKFDEKGNRFNPNKIAYDPYSVELSHVPSDVSSSTNSLRTGANFYLIDNAKYAVKSVYLYNEDTEITKVTPRPFNSEIIGEVHIKDLTQNLSMQEKGTYKAAGMFAKNIKQLGITMIEFLPINEFDTKQNGTNHWGYMPLGYFTLSRRYAFDKSKGKIIQEFRQMIDEFHKNDIKVCLDMVYNHTGEAGLINQNPDDASQLSYSLVDNASYYKTYPNGYYRSNSGCGNDFNVAVEGTMNLIVESIAFWAKQGVDAFRFDLAAALLECNCNCEEIYDSHNSLAAQLKEKLKAKGINTVDNFHEAQDGIVLIAEPWTCGGKNCYQLGNFPNFWAEWNDISRDVIRKSTIRPNDITPWMLKEVIEGTPSKFHGIAKSINFIAVHDGFTLFDLNSFNQKSISTQGGSDWETCSNYNGSHEQRENAIRKQLALLFLSYGIPMVQIGDIIMHSKNGNNNSYNKDDGTNYLNWQKATTKNTFENRIMEYIRNLINFRNSNPIFRSENYINSIKYYYNNGQEADQNNSGYWNNPMDLFFGFSINTNSKRIFVASSKSNQRLNFTLPKAKENLSWYKCIDTSDFHNVSFEPKDYIEKDYILNPNALAIFIEK